MNICADPMEICKIFLAPKSHDLCPSTIYLQSLVYGQNQAKMDTFEQKVVIITGSTVRPSLHSLFSLNSG